MTNTQRNLGLFWAGKGWGGGCTVSAGGLLVNVSEWLLEQVHF